MSCLMIAAFCAGALLDVQRASWSADGSTAFVADFDLDERGEIAVLSRKRLDVYERSQDGPTYSISLPDTTSVVDVADADGDGTADIVLISGEQIMRIPLAHPSTAPTAIPCFSRENQYSQYSGAPFPGVLVIHREEKPLVALPCAEALELRTLDGELVDSYPIGMDAPRRLALGQPFSVWANPHAQLGPDSALEFRVSSVATFKPLLPDDALPLDIAEPSGRFGTPRQQREATGLAPDRWPWFPVNVAGTEQVRALYARDGVPGGQTAIRVRHIRESPAQGEGESTGPVRHYPGLLLQHAERLPDFNGDGFHDLLLWKSERIVPTVDSLARATARGTWPIRIIAHAYAPAKKRFEAPPLGTIELEVPLAWYIASGLSAPLDTLFLHDINDDARTDFGCLTGAGTLAFWLSGADGFSPRPDFEYEFPEPILAVALELDLEGQGRTTIALQGKQHLYILRPDTTFSR